jgi:hypothetical protein
MYSRDFGGIRSEGQLYNFEREYNEARSFEQKSEDHKEACPETVRRKGPLDFLRTLEIDDLILIGIGILLLLDSEEENDILVLIIALMLLF